MGLFNRLKTVTGAAIKTQLSGDTRSETDLDALAEAELEAELTGTPRVRKAMVGPRPTPTLPAEPTIDAGHAPSPAVVVQGPGGKRSL